MKCSAAATGAGNMAPTLTYQKWRYGATDPLAIHRHRKTPEYQGWCKVVAEITGEVPEFGATGTHIRLCWYKLTDDDTQALAVAAKLFFGGKDGTAT